MRKLLKAMIPLAEFDCDSIDEAVERGYCDIYDGTFITNDKGVKYEDCTSVIIYERELDNDKYDELFEQIYSEGYQDGVAQAARGGGAGAGAGSGRAPRRTSTPGPAP